MLNVAPLIFFALALGLAAGSAGTLTTSLSLLSALACVCLGVLVGGSKSTRRFRGLVLVLAFCTLGCGLGLLATSPGGRVSRLFAFALLFVGVDLAFRAFGRLRRELHAAAAAALFSALFFLILSTSPPVWLLYERLSLLLSHLAGRIVARPLALGPTYSGLNVTALSCILVCVIFILRRQRKPKPFIHALLFLLSTWFIYLAGMTFLPHFETDDQARIYMNNVLGVYLPWLVPVLVRHVPWNLPAVLVVLQLPSIWLAASRADSRPVRVWPSTSAGVCWAGALALSLLLGVAALVVRLPERPVMTRTDGSPTRIVLRKQGFLNWVQPDFEDFGEYSGGMFGRLPVFLRQLGFDVSLRDVLDADALDGVRVAVVINPYEAMSTAEHAAIWDFVNQGGSLLVVGEHTWLNEKKQPPLDDLLRPSAIRVNFDSATWQIGGWLYNYDFSSDPIYHGVGQHLNEAGVGIGASLELRLGARPLLLGVNGFSDAGHIKTPAELQPGEVQQSFLGDNRYVPGEPFGDLVLVAEQHVGKGRVVVFGDTTTFVNLLMVGSHRPAARIFARLASAPRSRGDFLRLSVALACFVTACVLFAINPWRFVLPVLLVSVLSGFGLCILESWHAGALELIPQGEVAYVDGSHAGKYSRDSWRDDGAAGLQLNLMRNGLQPLRMDTFSEERLNGARMFFIIAPTRTFTTREAEAVERFVYRGGYVVVSAGADSAEAVAPVLSRFDLRVRNIPLGPFTTYYADTRNTLRMRVAYTVEHVRGDTDGVLAWSWFGKPRTHAVVIEHLAPGPSPETGRRGGLLLIGDDQFFLNENLETGKKKPVMENVTFFRWLIRHVNALKTPEDRP